MRRTNERCATWEDAADIVRERHPTIPEQDILHGLRSCKLSGSAGGHFRPSVTPLEYAAYSSARRNPEWRLRILSLERRLPRPEKPRP